MAIKKKKGPETGKKKIKGSVKSVKKAVTQKKVQKKKTAPRKETVSKKIKTKKISGPAKKTVKKKVAPKGIKAKIKPKVKSKKTSIPKKRVSLKTAKPASKRPARKKPSASTRAKAAGELSRREMLRKLLIRRREEIVREAKAEIAKYIKGEANQLAETALDDGDWSVIDLSADINLRLLESHRGSLLKIDESLRKLREGSYGVCEDCGSEISAERLKVMPFAIFCRDCQERREELEEATREGLPG